MSEGKGGYQPNELEVRAALGHMASEDREASEARDIEKWKVESKPVTDWLLENQQLASQEIEHADSFSKSELERIFSGQIWRHELSFLNSIIEKNEDPKESIEEIVSYVQKNYDELYPVGIWDSQAGRWL